MTTQPTPAFRQRHAIEAPKIDARTRRPYWLVISRFGRLYTAGRINHASMEAGRMWREDCERVSGRSPPQFSGLPAGITPGARTPGDDQLDAQARLRVARDKLGADAVALLTRVIIEDKSWRSLAKQHRVTTRTLQNAFSETLDQLAELYDGHSERSDGAAGSGR